MLTSHWVTNSAAAKAYYEQSDYYAAVTGEWLGDGAKMLGLEGTAKKTDFELLCDNINPLTGKNLTKYTKDNRRVGIDLTFSSTKSVGIVREMGGIDNLGDERVQDAHREAVAYAMKFVEQDMQCRVRVNNSDHNRTTSNLIAYRVTHRDTRISAEDSLPDMELHDHVFVLNATYDKAEGKWKAAELGEIKHDGGYYEAIYHNRLAGNLRQLGYGIERKGKAFEVAGVTQEMNDVYSRRTKYIKQIGEKLGIKSQEALAKLGATTRLGKAKHLADDLNAYWVSRLTDEQREALQNLEGQPSYESTPEKATQYAIEHLFERKSVVEPRKVYETALRQGIGSVTPESIEAEALRQGLLIKDKLSTTQTALDQEQRIVELAKDGIGKMAPLFHAQVTGLSKEQTAVAHHVLHGRDQFAMVMGLAGVGKTTVQRKTGDIIESEGLKVIALAQSSDASRRVLVDEGFKDANTIASFLLDEKAQEKARNQVISLDEGSLVGTKTLLAMFEAADRLNARLVIWGDDKQHGSIERGAVMEALQGFLPVPQMKDIRRQTGDYKNAVQAIGERDILKGYDILDRLGWVKQVDNHRPLVDDYMVGLSAGKQMLVVAPTHAEGDAITEEIRGRLKQAGVIKDEQTIPILKSTNWTDAEKGDAQRYTGNEVIQFVKNAGAFKAGQKLSCGLVLGASRAVPATSIAVYTPDEIRIGAGDVIRATGNGWDVTRKHRINNGSEYTVKRIDEKGITLTNGWTLARDFGHLAHGYVSTSYASQGKTVDRVLIAMGQESRPAINTEQFYVSASRGRESLRIYSGMPAEQLREAIQCQNPRMTAMQLIPQKPVKRPVKRKRLGQFMSRIHSTYKQLRERVENVIGVKQRERVQEYGYER